MREIVFELCAESVGACVAARTGGADRIELCSALSEGGLTPDDALIREAVARSGLPVHAMVRPRGGGFVYTEAEFAGMRRDVERIGGLGVAGLVFGMLRSDGRMDGGRTAELVGLAGPLEVTFHRAFDEVRSLAEGLEEVIAAGCGRVLTSGGARDVVAGAEVLAELVKQAAGRIAIAVGGGLRLGNAAAVARATGARHFHGTLLHEGPRSAGAGGEGAGAKMGVDARDVRAMMETLKLA